MPGTRRAVSRGCVSSISFTPSPGSCPRVAACSSRATQRGSTHARARARQHAARTAQHAARTLHVAWMLVRGAGCATRALAGGAVCSNYLSAADSHAWKAWISPSCWQIRVLSPSAVYRLVEARLPPALLSLAPPSSLATAVGSVPSCCGAGCLRAAAAPAAASSCLTGSQWHSHWSRKASRLDVAE